MRPVNKVFFSFRSINNKAIAINEISEHAADMAEDQSNALFCWLITSVNC